MKTKVAINGFGRIGRNVFKAALAKDADFDIVAINDVTNPKTLAHLLKYDSCFGPFDGKIEVAEDAIIVNDHEVKITAVRNPLDLPWEEFGVEVVLESTGLFNRKEYAIKHISAGAKKVIITAPAFDDDISIVMGANEDQYVPDIHHVISSSSCTTNCLAPIVKIIDREFGIDHGLITTVHSYTNDQKILDLPHKDLRRARAAGLSIIPTTTGAARAIDLILPNLAGRLNGMAIRVPTSAVSVIDAVLELTHASDIASMNAVLKKAADEELPEYIGYCDEPLVSIDFKGDKRSAIVDSLSTMFVGDRAVKVIAWYDNEWGYSNRVVDLTEYVIKAGL
jgi:glyceraldehyde 3-phosphate dehydrogenase